MGPGAAEAAWGGRLTSRTRFSLRVRGSRGPEAGRRAVIERVQPEAAICANGSIRLDGLAAGLLGALLLRGEGAGAMDRGSLSPLAAMSRYVN